MPFARVKFHGTAIFSRLLNRHHGDEEEARQKQPARFAEPGGVIPAENRKILEQVRTIALQRLSAPIPGDSRNALPPHANHKLWADFA